MRSKPSMSRSSKMRRHPMTSTMPCLTWLTRSMMAIRGSRVANQGQRGRSLESGNADYVGIGIISSPVDKSVGVVYVFPNSPADQAGIKRRDRITSLDGIPFVDPAKEAGRIRGPQGTTVKLSVVSPEQAERTVSIVRGRVTGAVLPSSRRLSHRPIDRLPDHPDFVHR